jgi:hypothetical protein
MADVAVGQGVPKEALLLEDRSRTTWENARFSLELLRGSRRLAGLRVVLLVSAGWHLRRALRLVGLAFPPSVRLVCCAAPGGCTAADWATRDDWRRLVQQEWLLYQALLGPG